jgi:uncharacterized Ntn-hydrolase superfamily protein
MLAAGLSALAADVNTFSIVGYDPATGDLGVAVASRYFAVGSVVPWAEAGVGVVATQANVNVAYGPRGLELLRQGMPARDVLAKLLAEDSSPPTTGRQVAIIDRKGNIAVYTGPNAPKWAGDRRGATWSAQGNTVDPKVPEAMGKAFEATQGELAEKLFAALKAGDDAGGDTRGKQSASMLVVRKNGGRNLNNDRYVSINVDDNPAPIAELRRLLDLNLGLLYSEKAGSMLMAGKSREARDNASRAAHYRPEGHSYFLVATMDYSLGEKDAAIADFRKALKLDPALRQRLQAPPDSVPPGAGFMGRALREILVDKTFLDQALRP